MRESENAAPELGNNAGASLTTDRVSLPRGVAVVLFGLFLLLVAILTLSVFESNRLVIEAEFAKGAWSWIPHTLPALVESLMVAALTFILSEIPPVRDSIDKRLQSLVKYDFVERIRDDRFIRQFSDGFLREAESAFRRASFSPGATEIDGLLKAFDSVRGKLQTWRTAYQAAITVRPVPNHPDVFEFDIDIRWEYRNDSDEPVSVPQSFRANALKCSDIAPTDACSLTRLDIDGKDYLAQLTFEREEDTLSWKVAAELNIVVPPTAGGKGVTVHRALKFIQPRTAPFTSTLFSPVCGLQLTLNHPDYISPSLFVFGISDLNTDTDPLDAEVEQNGFHLWCYNGWLLANHGVVLIFDDTRLTTPNEVSDRPRK